MTIEDVKISEEAFYFLQENEIPNDVVESLSNHILRLIDKALEAKIDLTKAPHDENGNIYLVFISIYSANKDVSACFKIKYGIQLNMSDDYKTPSFIGIENITIIEGQNNVLEAMFEIKNKEGAVFHLNELDKSKQKENSNNNNN